MSLAPSERHMLVYCDTVSAADGVIDAREEDRSIIQGWIGQGNPLIARMSRETDPSGWIALGLPLPPDEGKKRIALSLAPEAILRIEPPPALRTVLPVFPVRYREKIDELETSFVQAGLNVRVVGSAAWQFLTNRIYLHATSDIDVVVHVRNMTQLVAALDVLDASDRTPIPRIDGEIVSANGEAVSWRELLCSSKDILVKALQGPRVMLRSAWLDQLREQAA